VKKDEEGVIARMLNPSHGRYSFLRTRNGNGSKGSFHNNILLVFNLSLIKNKYFTQRYSENATVISCQLG
jgi:hypothetical protein